MKKVIFLCAIAVLAFSACQQDPVRYTQDSPEIDTVKQLDQCAATAIPLQVPP